jgi:hypothetical protein
MELTLESPPGAIGSFFLCRLCELCPEKTPISWQRPPVRQDLCMFSWFGRSPSETGDWGEPLASSTAGHMVAFP